MPLTDALCRNARAKPGQAIRKLSERGLQLCLYPNGSKLWRIAYRFAGKPQTLSLGPYPIITLADARLERDKLQKSLKSGQNPQAQKISEKALQVASEHFQLWADRYILRLEREGRALATLTKQKWLLSMALPTLGKLSIRDITPPTVLEAVRKVESRGRLDTAVRLRATISTVFQDAVAAGAIQNDPASKLGRLIAKPRRKNHPGITAPRNLGNLLRAIDGYDGQPATIAALQLSSLLFQRPVELRKAEWPEFDLENAIWRIPAKRMKMKRDHFVPLPKPALVVLRQLQKITGQGRYLFPSVRTVSKPMSENTINAALRALGYSKDQHTAHGFRTTASTLLNGSGHWHPDAIERQMAHEDKNSVRKAYDHQTHWAHRVNMMEWWGDYLNSLKLGGSALAPVGISSHATAGLNLAPL